MEFVVTENNILDTELSINKLVSLKDKLAIDKREAELELSELKNKIRTGGRMHPFDYKVICDKQSVIKKRILSIEKSLADMSSQIQNKQGFKEELTLHHKQQSKSAIVNDLTVLRDFYMAFASDKTRVASMRAMSAEFAEKLEKVIKKL